MDGDAVRDCPGRPSAVITIRHGDIALTMERDQLAPWLSGLSRLVPETGTLSMSLESGQHVEITTSSPLTTRGERYSITIGGITTDLPADWVVSWASGLAASYGSDLPAALDPRIHGRNRRMQALMICHQHRWLDYIGITERHRP